MRSQRALIVFTLVVMCAAGTYGQGTPNEIRLGNNRIKVGDTLTLTANIVDTTNGSSLRFDQDVYDAIEWELMTSGVGDAIVGAAQGDSVRIRAGTRAYRYIRVRALWVNPDKGKYPDAPDSMTALAPIPVQPGPAYRVTVERDSTITKGDNEYAPDAVSTVHITDPDTDKEHYVYAFLRDRYNNILDEAPVDFGNVDNPQEATGVQWRILPGTAPTADPSDTALVSIAPFHDASRDSTFNWIGAITRESEDSARVSVVASQASLIPDTFNIRVYVGSGGPRLQKAVLRSPVHNLVGEAFDADTIYDTLDIYFLTNVLVPEHLNDTLASVFKLYDTDTLRFDTTFFYHDSIMVTDSLSTGAVVSVISLAIPHTYAREKIDIGHDSLALRLVNVSPLRDAQGAFVNIPSQVVIQGNKKALYKSFRGFRCILPAR